MQVGAKDLVGEEMVEDFDMGSCWRGWYWLWGFEEYTLMPRWTRASSEGLKLNSRRRLRRGERVGSGRAARLDLHFFSLGGKKLKKTGRRILWQVNCESGLSIHFNAFPLGRLR